VSACGNVRNDRCCSRCSRAPSSPDLAASAPSPLTLAPASCAAGSTALARRALATSVRPSPRLRFYIHRAKPRRWLAGCRSSPTLCSLSQYAAGKCAVLWGVPVRASLA
jgi:hypothetical protein